MIDDPRPMEEIGEELSDVVEGIIDNTAMLVNNIRRQVRGNLKLAEELEDLAISFRNIAELQQEAAYRVAQIGTESLSSEFLGETEEEEYIEFEEDEEDDED